jgi:hypothetical protein
MDKPTSQSGMSQKVQLALGRIFRLMSRPEQTADAAQYEACRALIIDAYEAAHGGMPQPDWEPDYARDRWAGAQGDRMTTLTRKQE